MLLATRGKKKKTIRHQELNRRLSDETRVAPHSWQLIKDLQPDEAEGASASNTALEQVLPLTSEFFVTKAALSAFVERISCPRISAAGKLSDLRVPCFIGFLKIMDASAATRILSIDCTSVTSHSGARPWMRHDTRNHGSPGRGRGSWTRYVEMLGSFSSLS